MAAQTSSIASVPPRSLSPSALDQVLSSHGPDMRHYERVYMHLHQNPELSCQESATAALVADHLEKLGFVVHPKVGGHGVVGVLRNGTGSTVLLRADMDALPVREETGLPYESQVRMKNVEGQERPVMHACGHDVHVVSLMAAAELLKSAHGAWTGTLICLFQPNEELGGGAQAMVDDDLYGKVPKPDVVLAQHVTPLKSGMIAIRPGPSLSEATSVKVRIYGSGGHGSSPQSCIDPIMIAAYVLVRLQSIVSRMVDPEEMAVVTCGSIHSGESANVIPDEAFLGINVRTYSHTVHDQVLARISSIVSHECEIAGCAHEPSIETTSHFPLTSNDEKLTHILQSAFKGYFKENLQPLVHNTASEDVSKLAEAANAPCVYWALGGTDHILWEEVEKTGQMTRIPGNHSSKFAPAIQPTLTTGVNALSIAALSLLAELH